VYWHGVVSYWHRVVSGCTCTGTELCQSVGVLALSFVKSVGVLAQGFVGLYVHWQRVVSGCMAQRGWAVLPQKRGGEKGLSFVFWCAGTGHNKADSE
jgi:hypothetical protein